VGEGRVLVTGGSGFVGSAVCKKLQGDDLVTIGRSKGVYSGTFFQKQIDSLENYKDCLDGVGVVVHCAARAHVMSDNDRDPINAYRSVNVDGTLNLARQSIMAGVKRFVFISSIKVNGESTSLDKCFTSDDIPAPEDAYGISKLEAEQGLFELSKKSEMEIVIIRPPLVYGPGVKGNFASMVNLLNRGLPLPLGAVNNKRSLIGIDNLVDMIITCIDHPAAANQVFLAGDGEDLSTTELLKTVASSLGRSSRLIPVPVPILMLAAKLIGKKRLALKVLGSLQVDISKARFMLGWVPPLSLEEGLKRCLK